MIKMAVIVMVFLTMGVVFAQSEVIHLGSKTDPDAPLFSYDRKFDEAMTVTNYDVGMFATKRYEDCTHLSSSTFLKSNPDWVDLAIGTNFTGRAELGYVVLDQYTMDRKNEMARVAHQFVGTFTLDDRILVIKNQMNESSFFGSCQCI